MVNAADALLVQTVSGLVHRPEQERQWLALHPARRDANIVGADGRGKRMDRPVLPPTGPIEAKGGNHLDGKAPHVSFAKRGAKEPGLDLGTLAERPDQLDLARQEHVEHLPNVAR